MNIALISTHLNTGGVVSYLFTLASGLIDRGHNVYVITSGGDRSHDFTNIGARVFTVDIKTKSELSIKLFRANKKIVQYCQENSVDIIHAQTRVTQVLAYQIARKLEIKYVATCHGFFKPKLSRRLRPCWGDKVIAISRAVVDHLTEDFHVPRDRVQMIHNGVNLEKIEAVSDQSRRLARTKFNIDDKLTCGIVARLSDVKGQDILVRAFSEVIKQCPDAQLLLIGQGKLEPLLKEMVHKYQLENNIYFYPVIDQSIEYFHALDVFVMPSRQEGLGLSIMEAQAAGLAVIASDVGGIPDIIKHNVTGILVPPENTDELSKAMINLLSDSNKRQELGESAKTFAHNHYSNDIMVRDTEKLYQELMEG